ncbi:MAG TPA: AEC family transporter [Chondromyces sp.]|nr:AEC family transporter [Chondromyces sp.]
MNAAFGTVFGAAASAIAAVFAVIVGAGLLVRRGVITQPQIDALSSATVNILLPCLIFAKVTETLDPASQPGWWALPIVGIAMALVGTGLGALVFARGLPEKRNLLPLAGMQNAGYLVLPVGLALYPDSFDAFALYVFLFILGYNPVLWSLGKVLISGSRDQPFLWRDLVTPPLLANLVAIAASLSGAAELLPRPFVVAVDLVGSAAVPVALLVLGAVLGSVAISLRLHLGDALRAMSVKLMLLPALTTVVVVLSGLPEVNPLLAEFLIIEAASAPPVAVVLQARTYGGDDRTIGSIMVLSYAACALSLPAWIAAWRILAVG